MSTPPKKREKSALGRGLNALLNDSFFLSEERPSSPMHEVAVEQIEVNPYQPRKDFDAAALEDLGASIKLHGIIQPLTVRQLTASSYQLIAGERRLQAAKLAGLAQVPAYVRAADDQQMLEMALIENIQREDLNPIEIALSYQRLLTECELKQEALGDRVGKNRTTVNNYLRLLKLPPDIQIALRDKKITMGHARALIGVEDTKVQLSLYKEIVSKDLSVRQVEDLVRSLADKPVNRKTTTAQSSSPQLKQATAEASRRLATILTSPVNIRVGAKEQGEIKIPFATLKELDRIMKVLVD